MFWIRGSIWTPRILPSRNFFSCASFYSNVDVILNEARAQFQGWINDWFDIDVKLYRATSHLHNNRDISFNTDLIHFRQEPSILLLQNIYWRRPRFFIPTPKILHRSFLTIKCSSEVENLPTILVLIETTISLSVPENMLKVKIIWWNNPFQRIIFHFVGQLFDSSLSTLPVTDSKMVRNCIQFKIK